MNRPVADLDRRFYAFVLDRAVAWAVVGAVAFLLVRLLGTDQVWVLAVAIVASWVLVGVGLAVVLGLTGWSPGNAVSSIRVVRGGSAGRPLGVRAALVRQFVLGVATLPTLGIGLAALAWTVTMDPSGQRRGWHDHLADSVVVDVRPLPADEPEEDAGPRHVVNLTALRLVPVPEPPRVPRPSSPPPSRPPEIARPAASTLPSPALPEPVRPAVAETVAPVPKHAAAVPAGAGAPSRQQLGYPLLPDPRPAGGAHVAAPEPTAARWQIGFDSGESFVVDGPVLVGRRPEPRHGERVHHLVPLPSDDMSLSKTHAQVLVTAEGSLVVTDRGSTNGSILIRQGVPRGLASGKAATLVAGDRVRFGDREMTVARVE